MDSIGKTGINQDRDPISIWRVCVPFDIDREVYVKNCFLTGTVCLRNENAEIVPDVKIGKMALQLIDFPEDNVTDGSEVACITAPYSGRLYVTEVYYTSLQYGPQKENQYRFFKTNGSSSATVFIDGNGRVLITVNGDGGIINITSDDIKVGAKRFEIGGADAEPMLLGTMTVDLLDEILTQLGKESAGPYSLLGNSKYLEIKDKLEKLKSKISFTK